MESEDEAIGTQLEHMHLEGTGFSHGSDRDKDPLELVQLHFLRGHDHGNVWSLSWSPYPCNGAEYMLAAGVDNSKTIVWHYQDSKWSVLTELKMDGKGSIKSCAWNFDGTLLAAGSFNSKIAIWEYNKFTDSFEFIAQLDGIHEQIINSLSWNKDELLLSCSNDGYISIIGKNKDSLKFDVKCRLSARDIAETQCAMWHPEKNIFVVGGHRKIKIYRVILEDQDVKAYHVPTIWKDELAHNSGVKGISYWKDGTFLASVGSDSYLKVWGILPINVSTSSNSMNSPIKLGEQLESQILSRGMPRSNALGGFSCCDWSRCCNQSIGNLIASGCLFNDIHIFFQYDKDGELAYDVGAIKLQAHNGRINDLKWHHEDAELFASASSEGIKIWGVKGQVPYSSNPRSSLERNSNNNKRTRKSSGGIRSNLKKPQS